MGAKSRGNWAVGKCFKDCIHQGCEEICGSCIRFSNLNSKMPTVFEMKEDGKRIAKYGKDSLRFYPHYNNAFGKFISTKGEYLSEMKKGGYEPYTGEAPRVKRETPDMRPTGDVLKAIERCSNKDGTFSPGSALKSELMKRGVVMTKEARQAYINKVNEMTR